MRVKHKANVVISNDKDGKDRLFGLDDTMSEAILDGFTEANTGTVALLNAGTFTIPFGGVGVVRGLFLKVTGGDLKVSLNGLDQITVMRGVTGANGGRAVNAKLLLEAALSSVEVEAVGAVSVIYAVWGDPLP